MIDGYDLTFPRRPPTGRERGLSDLSQPDERSVGYGLDVESLQAPFLELEAHLPQRVPKQVRTRIVVARDLAVYGYFCYEFHAVSTFWSISCIEMALKRKFAESHQETISLKRRKDGVEETCNVRLAQLEKRLREKWRIPGMKYFDFSFRALLTWAFQTNLLPDDLHIPLQEIVHTFNNRFLPEIFFEQAVKEGLLDQSSARLIDVQLCWASLPEKRRKHYQYKLSEVLIEELPRFRNEMAHPRWNLVTPPRSALGAYELLIDIARRLWSDPPTHDVESNT